MSMHVARREPMKFHWKGE